MILASVLLLLVSAPASATAFELSRLANQIHLVSAQMADQLRHVRNYGGVRKRANRLAREARQLDNALRRNRSNSFVRSKFRDVSRRYQSLEETFLREDRRRHNDYAYSDMSILSDLYGRLRKEFNYSRFSTGKWNNTWSNSSGDSWRGNRSTSGNSYRYDRNRRNN